MILVTGGTGFLGAHVVCELLENNRQVRAIKRATSTLQEFNYIFISTKNNKNVRDYFDIIKLKNYCLKYELSIFLIFALLTLQRRKKHKNSLC